MPASSPDNQFPNMPYHANGKAQQRLAVELSDNTLYLTAARKSFWGALSTLWREASAAAASS